MMTPDEMRENAMKLREEAATNWCVRMNTAADQLLRASLWSIAAEFMDFAIQQARKREL